MWVCLKYLPRSILWLIISLLVKNGHNFWVYQIFSSVKISSTWLPCATSEVACVTAPSWTSRRVELEQMELQDGSFPISINFPTDVYNRRKFRSQTSSNMDRWKSRGGKSQRREENKKEDQRRERGRRQKMQVREKVEKSRFTVFFQWFAAREGRKVGSLKRRVRSHLARWEMKNCTPLWREAHFKVKMHKTHQRRSTFGSWDVEKVHAVVARSAFGRNKCKKLTVSDHFWKLRWWNSARCISNLDMQTHTMHGALLEVEMMKKCTLLWREGRFEVKRVKNWRVRSNFGRSDVVLCGRRKGVAKREGFIATSRALAGVGHFKIQEDLQRCISRGRRRHVHQRC